MPRQLRSSASQSQIDFKARKSASTRVARKGSLRVKNTNESTVDLKNSEDVLRSPKRSPKRPLASLENIRSPEGVKLHDCNIRVEKLKLDDCSPSKILKADIREKLQKCITKVVDDVKVECNNNIPAKDENCSPREISKTDVQKLQENTPKKSGTPRKLQFDNATTPSRVLSPAVTASPVRASPRLKKSNRNQLLSPSKENCLPSPRTKSVSPQKCRALSFTPSKSENSILKAVSPIRNSAVRSVFSSPLKRDDHVFKTPTKRPARSAAPTFVSPLKVPQSPVRSLAGLSTPTKQPPPCCPVMSPGGVPISPRKQSLRSPCKAVRAFEERCYKEARKALHATQPASLIGRDQEMSQIDNFIESHISKKQPGSLYISGAPGTGKTACLTELRQNLQNRKDCKEVYINCMSFKNSQAIFNRILSEIQQKTSSLTMKAAMQQLEKLLVAKGAMVVCILDEVDQLDSKHQEVLYTMFEWPSLSNSRLVLVGIANALDLTDRVLPRLQGHQCKPQLLHFAPYTKQQIIDVLEDRLASCDVLEPSALKFCAMKVATVAGDMRKALDICRRAIELAEVELRKKKACATPEKFGAPVKKIGIAHVMRIINEVYGNRAGSQGSSRGGGSGSMPVQQKLAVCTLLLMLKNTKAKEVTIGKLHEKYCVVCKRQEVAPAKQSEFTSLCSLIEARGIIAIKKGKDIRMSKVTLKLDENELEQALQDKVLMSAILQQGL